MDAAQFFKAATVSRGLRRTRRFLRRLADRSHKLGVAVQPRAAGVLANGVENSKTHRFCSFAEMEAGITYASHDKYFLVGLYHRARARLAHGWQLVRASHFDRLE